MKNKPNVLILFTDQQRYDTICAAGFSHMITPNLDRLASQGCTYVNAYSSNPVCMPARHDMMTGLRGRAHGYYANMKNNIKDYSLPTLPRIFSEAGYRTAGIGKMHFHPCREHHGFGELQLMEEIPDCRQDDQYAMFLDKEGLGHLQNIHGVRPHVYHAPQNAQMDEKHHGSTWVADRTIDWLKENKEQSYFLFAGWIQPHPPWDIPEEFQGIYGDRPLPEPIPVSRCRVEEAGCEGWYGDEDTAEQKRKVRQAYYSAITHVDKNIGRILDYLEETGTIDNTLIIFTSDHGEMLYDKGYFSKEVPYDSAARIPFIVRYPARFEQGAIKEEFVDLLDILPTCLDVCGLMYNGEKFNLPGESLCGEKKERDREHQICCSGTGTRRWLMSRSKQYKYTYYYNQGIEEFFDMINDPGETVNLIETGDYPKEEYRKLKRKAMQFEKEWGPEDVIIHDEFKVVSGQPFHPSIHGKFHLWSNMDMQYFDDRSNKERGAEFIREIEHALANEEHSGVKLNEVFNDPLWRQNFMEHWEKFGTGKEILKKLFQSPS